MKRGFRILIVALVAIGTNLGLHAAFGWCGKGHWNRNGGNGYNNGCGPNNNAHWNGGGCGWNNNCADPWNCSPNGTQNNAPADTVKK